MGHNLHLIVVLAESAEAACDKVESAIEDFGNENNWRTIYGAVSQNDEPYFHEGNQWPDENCDTIEKINKLVEGWLPYPKTSRGELFEALTNGTKTLKDVTDYMDWLMLSDYAEHMTSVARLGKTTFDILAGDEFKSGDYTSVGVTNLTHEGEEDAESDDQTYVVFVDMHS